MDEAFGVWVSSHSIHEIFRILQIDAHPPLFYLFLHGWMRLAGRSEGWLRFPFALIGALNAVLIYTLIRTAAGERWGVLTGIFWAASYYALSMETQVRMYPPALGLSLLSAVVFLRAVRRPDIARWTLYVIIAACALYAHYYTGLVVAAELVYLFCLRRLKEAILLSASIIVLFSPWIPELFFQWNNFTGWKAAAGPSLWGSNVFSTMLGLPFFQEQSAAGNWLAAAAVILGSFFIFRKRAGEFFFLWLLFFIPCGMLLAAHALKLSYVQWFRHAIFFAPFFYALLVLALLNLPRPFFVSLTAAFLAMNLANGYLFLTAPADERQNWRSAAEFLKANMKSGDTVAVEQVLSLYPLWYYLPGQFEIKQNGLWLEIVPMDGMVWLPVGAKTPESRLLAAARSSRRMWLILCQPDVADPQSKMLKAFRRHFIFRAGRVYRSLRPEDDIRVFLFSKDQGTGFGEQRKTSAGGALRATNANRSILKY